MVLLICLEDVFKRRTLARNCSEYYRDFFYREIYILVCSPITEDEAEMIYRLKENASFVKSLLRKFRLVSIRSLKVTKKHKLNIKTVPSSHHFEYGMTSRDNTTNY